MTTKLDELVGHLAGREGSPGFLDELADPSSEASLFLEATRNRSRALIPDPPSPLVGVQPSRFRPWVGSFAWGTSSVVAIALVMAFWWVDGRLHRIESSQAERDAETRASASRLESSLDRLLEAPPDPSPVLEGIGRVANGLEQLDRRLETLERLATPSKPDPVPARLRDELANLRFELSAAEKARTRQSEEMQASVHEVGRVLKLLINRIDPPGPTTNPDSPRLFPAPRSSGNGNPRIEP